MKTGLLWFDSEPGTTLAQKVGRAATHYRQKFGRQANLCYVHPSLLDGDGREVDGVRVEPLRSMLRHHFWIGEEECDERE